MAKRAPRNQEADRRPPLRPATAELGLRELCLPIPSLLAQQTIMKRVEVGRAKIAKLKTDAKARADAAKANIEAMILGTKLVA